MGEGQGGETLELSRLIDGLPDDLRRRHDAVCAVDMALNTATTPGRPMNADPVPLCA